jgi:hypothetical protein
VKNGITAANGHVMPMGGWCGKVYEASGTICLIHWSEATLEAIPSIYREQWQRDGVDLRVMWLQEKKRIGDRSRGTVVQGAAERRASASG